MNKENFVIVSLSPWDFEYGSNIRDIALELSKKHEVVFVNIPVKRTEVWKNSEKWMEKRKKVIKSKRPHFEKINESCTVLTLPVVFEPINRLKNKFLFNIFNRLNGKKYASAIKKALASKNIDDYILINDNDFYSGFHLPDYLNSKLNVYYLRDYLRAMDYWKCHSDRIEPLIIEKYDIVLTNSAFLSKYAEKWNKKSYYVGQGCDVEFFLKKPTNLIVPDDLKSIKGKIVGYVGALNSERLNIDLIEYIARDSPNLNIVLIGPEDEQFKSSSLHDIDNVHFLGTKDFDQLREYIYSFDACFNPQKINEITIGNYPRKVDEYLAVGKPVIASYTETMVPFISVTYLAKDNSEFSKRIKLALEEDSVDKENDRKEFAAQHTWENSVGLMLKYLQ